MAADATIGTRTEQAMESLGTSNGRITAELSNGDSQDLLRATIRFLGNLLGETIIEQEGKALFDLEEQIRALAKKWRAGDDSARDEIIAVTTHLIEEPAQALAVLKAFTIYFQLVNLAEE